MATIVDARGLACPQPVIKTRKALQEHGAVTTVVANPTAALNVTRMARGAGYLVEAETREDGTYLRILPGSRAEEQPDPTCAPVHEGGPVVLLVSSEFMGHGDEELGRILMRSFFHTLGEVQPLPSTVVFVNSGVKLVVADSPILDDLRALFDHGIALRACGTCLGHYGLKERVAVGEVTNMYAIAETLLCAGKVVSL